jgi:nucleoside-diphosphate-sugar epimerase
MAWNILFGRPFNIITPYETAEGDQGTSHVFADYIKKIIIDKTEQLEIIGDGEQIRCFTWIDEISQAIADYSFGDIKNESFNLGNMEPITMKQLAQLIHDAGVEMSVLPDKQLLIKGVKSYKNDVIVRIPSSTKALLKFGWRAEKKVKDSIKICVENAINTTKS